MHAANARPAPLASVRDLTHTLQMAAKIGHTSIQALRAPDSDLYPTALRQAYLLVTAYRGADITECAQELRRHVSSAKVLLTYGKQELFNPRSLVARYTHELCSAYQIDFASLRNQFNR